MIYLKVLCTCGVPGQPGGSTLPSVHLKTAIFSRWMGLAGCHQDPEEACPTEEKETCFLYSLKQKENILEFFLIKEENIF